MKNLLIITLFISFSFESTGQQQTNYEKKCFSLTIELLNKLGIDGKSLNNFKKMNDLEKILVSENFLKKLYTENGILLLSEYERKMSDATKLKTSVDLQREKDNKTKQESEERLKEIETEKRNEFLEKERAKQEIIEKYNNSDFVKIKTEVISRFQTWLLKNEFEKTEQYENRIKLYANKNFEDINVEEINSKLERIENNIRFSLGTYNADKEYFPITINFKELEWNDTINIEINKASKFKEKFDFQSSQITLLDWGIYENNFYPSKIEVKFFDKKYQFVIPKIKITDYKVTPSSFGFKLSNLNDIEFSFYKYQQNVQKEKELSEIKRESEKQNNELRYKKEKEFNDISNTDYGKLIKEIGNELKNWQRKMQFESELDYQDRLQNKKESEFQKILDSTIKYFHFLNNSLETENLTLIGKITKYEADNSQLIVAPTTIYTNKLSVIIADGGNFNGDLSEKYNQITIHSKYSLRTTKELAEALLNNSDDKNEITIIPKGLTMYNNNWQISKAYIIFNYDPTIKIYSIKFTDSSSVILNISSNEPTTFMQSNRFHLLNNRNKPKPITIELSKFGELENSYQQLNRIPKKTYFYYWSLDKEPNYKSEKVNDFNFNIEFIKNLSVQGL